MSNAERQPLWQSRGLIAAFSLAAAALNLLPHWRVLLFSGGDELYFLPIPAAHDYLAALAWMLILAFVVYGLSAATASHASARRFPSAAPLIMIGLCALVAINAIEFVRATFFKSFRDFLVFSGAVSATAAILVAVIWRRGRLGVDALATLAVVTIAAFSPFALTTSLQAIARAVALTSTPERAELGSALDLDAPQSAKNLRVVWMIFDELDARVLRESRSSYDLAAIEVFRTQSVHSTLTLPPGGGTIQAMPSLWLGQRLSGSEPRGRSDLEIQFEPSEETQRFGDRPNLFTDLNQRNLTIGAIGFHHPYCRLFAPILARCAGFHASSAFYFETASFDDSFGSIALSLYPNWRRRVTIDIYERSRAAALDMVSDQDLDFVAIHWNTPHDPPIYDSRAGELRTSDFGLGYQDNLVLADRTLRSVDESIRLAGLEDRTVVILSSDHGWRKREGFKTDAGAIPLLVRMPRQRLAVEIPGIVDSLTTRSLILALMDGDLDSANAVARFVEAESGEPPERIGQ